jgi:hypothetical protein
MKIENLCVVTMDERDCKQAAVNGGIKVDLPPGTVSVVVKVAWQAQEKAE